MSQNKLIREHLTKHGSITDLEAYQRYGIRRLGARIWDLRHKYGMDIETQDTVAKNRYGVKVRFATYKIA